VNGKLGHVVREFSSEFRRLEINIVKVGARVFQLRWPCYIEDIATFTFNSEVWQRTKAIHNKCSESF
jgi:hypothetical protein